MLDECGDNTNMKKDRLGRKTVIVPSRKLSAEGHKVDLHFGHRPFAGTKCSKITHSMYYIQKFELANLNPNFSSSASDSVTQQQRKQPTEVDDLLSPFPSPEQSPSLYLVLVCVQQRQSRQSIIQR